MKTQRLMLIGVRSTKTRATACSLFFGALLTAPTAWSQEANAEPKDGKVDVDIEDHSEERPEPAGGTAFDDAGDAKDPKIIEGAGMGSDVAYGDQGVVELGGIAALDVRNELVDFSIAPTLGYFLVDRFELTLIPILRVRSVEDPTGAQQTNTRFALILEPSYHLPFNKHLYGFVGVGVGFTYESGPGLEALLRPVVGLDVMIGRSGIFKPAGFIDVGLGAGAIGGGFQAGYTVMF